jgi:hypothetical protein
LALLLAKPLLALLALAERIVFKQLFTSLALACALL